MMTQLEYDEVRDRSTRALEALRIARLGDDGELLLVAETEAAQARLAADEAVARWLRARRGRAALAEREFVLARVEAALQLVAATRGSLVDVELQEQLAKVHAELLSAAEYLAVRGG
jgi:hypothetical protein